MRVVVSLFLVLFLVSCSSMDVNKEIESIKEANKDVSDVISKDFQELENTSKEVVQEVVNTTPVVFETVKESASSNITTEKFKEVNWNNPDFVIAIGDSMTYGHGLSNPQEDAWPTIYSNKINSKLYNYAVSGATSYSARYYQLELLNNDSIGGNKLIFIWIGANDAKNLISPVDYEFNYRVILEELRDIPSTKVVLINIPDVTKLSVAEDIQKQADTYIDSYLTQYGLETKIRVDVKMVTAEALAVYNGVVSKLADEYGLQVIDMFDYLDTFPDSMITQDRFHPNELGHQLIAQKVYDELMSE